MNWRSDDRGQSAGPEMMILLVFALAAWGVLAWLGRLGSTSQDIANTAQAAARAASIAADPAAGRAAAARGRRGVRPADPVRRRPRRSRWTGPPATTAPGSAARVTVTLSCTIANDEPFAAAGRTVSARDTQVIDPYRVALRRVREF